MKPIVTEPLCLCHHPLSDHGDRAVLACLGGWNGPHKPFTVPACPCDGYRAGKPRRRKAA